MGKKKGVWRDHDPVEGAELLRRVFPMLGRLAESGTQRDRAGNRQLLFSQYAALVLVGLLNPVLQSARALVAASGLKNVRQLTGGKKVSLGAFSEAASVFEPALLEALVQELREKALAQHHLRSLACSKKERNPSIKKRAQRNKEIRQLINELKEIKKSVNQ